MAEYIIQEETLVGIADAIRSKTGESGQVAVADMADKISGIAVDEKVEATVTLDFSEGDMEVVPEDGTVFSSVSIPTPATLIPENIAEGVDIAGIVGALAAGGGASFNWGQLLPSGTGTETITHNLGVVPDVIYIWLNTYTAGKISRAFGCSSALKTLFGTMVTSPGHYVYTDASGYKQLGFNHTMDTTTSGPAIHNVTTNQFSFGNSTYPLITGYRYTWIAVGGLT